MAHQHELIGIGPYCWARGTTVREVIKGLRKEWHRHLIKFSTKLIRIYQCPKGSKVSEVDGSILRPKGHKRCPDCKQIY